MKISTEERLLGLFGYLLFLFLIPLFAKRDSMFVQFHARQGGVMFGLYVVFSLIVLIVMAFTNAVAVVQTIFISLWLIFNIVYAVFVFIALFKVLLGERYRMPVVADIALKMNL